MTGDEKARDRAARVGSARDEGARAGVLAALPDQADRDLARDALDRTIFVTAGAGAGKTSVLVHRICALVTNAADPVPIQAVAAVTFTEKAAAEMRDRVRAELTERAHGEDERVAELAREALDDLDLAAIGTLHSFAARLLRESPIEAKLPPVITALDEVASGVRGERWWRRVHADLQQGEDTALAMQVLLAMAVGVDALKEIAQAMQANWDLVQDRFAAGGAFGEGASGGLAGRAPAASTGRAATRAPTDPSAAVRPAASVRALVLDIDPLRRAVTAMERRAAEECRRDSDRLHARVGALREWLNSIEAAGDDFERLALLARPFTRRRVGTQANWDDVDSARAQVEEAVQTGLQARAAFIGAALDIIVSALASAVLTEADARRREGTLLFQDLLVLARNMLRTSEAARLAAHGRYRRLLLDEFQDTDPLQIEIAVRIVAGAQGGHERWQDCPVPAGSLFVVGDPKQSIYRFRRANIATFLAAQDVLSGAPGESGGSQGPGSPAGGAASGGTGAPGVTGALRTGALGGTGAGGRAASLRTNFRSHPAVLDWVNAVFARLIRFEPDGQPPYVPLEPAPDRVALHAGDSAPRVTVLGAEALGEKVGGDVLREREAREVAGAIARMLRDRPVVESRRGGQWISRPVQEDDICVLVPARTSLKELEKALDHLNIPFRTEASSLVYRSDEVRDLLLTARAIDDPTDGLALVESLRTPLFGCGDDDLLTWKEAGGRFSIFASRPESLDESHPVADSLVFLRRMARQRSQLAPSELLATIVAERRALEVATDTPMYRETWRRLRFVVDQARAWSEAEHGSLRDFLDWATRQGIEEEKANEIVLPDKDTRSIRILTVHAAKGLEFPVVVLSGMTTSPSSGAGRVVWPDAGPPEVSARQGVSSRDWEESSEREKRMLSLEALRLLYVAATRAESRLVVSLVREFDARGSAGRAVEWAGPSGAGTSDEGGADIPSGTRAALLAWAAQGAGHEAWSAPEDGVPPLPVAPRNPTPPVPWADWVAIRDSARAAASWREADSATDIAHGHAPVPEGLELAPGLLKEPRDLELLAWLKGRYGAAVGRAVHGTLQTVDLRTGIGLDGIAEAQALAEGVLDRVGDVRALARAGWESATIRAAAAREHHKETYVGTVIGDQLIEGYIDLLFRDDDGSLVVVDYKTDATPTAETVAAYRGQLAVYARALGDATGDRVSRCVLVFCREGGAVEMTVPSAVQSS